MRNMRRGDRRLPVETANEILEKGEYGIFATVDKDGQPYGVPVNYVLLNGALYFHSADADSSKYDNILINEKVSFTVVVDTKVLSDQFATLYKSAIVLGNAKVVEDEPERSAVFNKFIDKYSPDFIEEGKRYIEAEGSNARIVKITIKSLTAKGRIKE